jgi:hypothetical protein
MHVDRILNWQENLASEEMPPAWMWSLDDDLEDWFDRVKADRDEKYGRNSSDDWGGIKNEWAPMIGRGG